MISRLSRLFFLILFFTVSFTFKLYAQLLTPRVSPQAKIIQYIGISTVGIEYSRPSVNGRTIWGKLVPFGLEKQPDGSEIPWRAGANENTIISFSHDVKVEGKQLYAGSYGLHMIPGENEWIIIFSKNYTSWGSYTYDINEDALRVTVKPLQDNFLERLTYDFENITNSSAVFFLRWEKIKVPVKLEFDAEQIVIQNYKNQLRGELGYLWETWYEAAFYCMQNNTNLDQAEVWIRKSISINQNPQNKNMLGYILKANNKTEEAIKVFMENIKIYPSDWNVYESLAEALAETGRINEAVIYYKIVYEKAPDAQKPRIKDILNNLNSH